MSNIQLTTGSIEKLLSATQGDNDLREAGYVLQLLQIKKISTTPDCFKLVISDGIHYTHALLATQLTGMVDNGEISKYSIVKVEEFTLYNIQNKKLLIVSALTPVGYPEEKIGGPVVLL